MNNQDKPLIWYDAERFPQKYWAVYDKKLGPSRYEFMGGKSWPLANNEEVTNFDGEPLSEPYQFIYRVDGDLKELSKWDVLANTFSSPLVNARALRVLNELCPNDFQVFDTTVKAKDGVTKEYKLLNILRLVDSIDMEKSMYTWSDPDEKCLINLKQLHFNSSCMQSTHLARDKQLPMILVSRTLRDAFRKNKIKGAKFLEDQEAYNIPYPEEYLESVFPEKPEAAKRYFVATMNNKQEYEFFKTRIHKIPREILETLIDMTLSRSSFHKEQCEEIQDIIKKEGR